MISSKVYNLLSKVYKDFTKILIITYKVRVIDCLHSY